MLLKPSLKNILKLYFSSALIYSIGILMFRYIPYYQKTLSEETQKTLLYLYLCYLVISPIYYLLFTNKYSTNKPYLFLQGIKNYLINRRIEFQEKVAILFVLVKVFFLPLMVNFFFGNYKSLIHLTDNFQWYHFALTLIFTIDTLIFAFGYTFEFKKIKNVVKSVEPTFFGWFVALICYPPFNGITGNYILWGANDYATFWNPKITFILRIILIFCLTIYLWASIALGPKASNLTNRGIVTKFPYSIVRHPAYINKNLIWWLTLLPVINWKFALGMLFWTFIYFFRALTEERHLKQDPDYLEYCKKVKWKFIPFIY
ncbi:MAG: methyltransferase [Nanoarchaeota archaeon]|nr:hypothetical protein [Nanoarchaeota archaeon]MBU1631675.1 hypothetical protein [Nanoarchaeota archaeon]MBU1875558.1 hypothetical protein [Nanoarchaeota archaeon]